MVSFPIALCQVCVCVVSWKGCPLRGWGGERTREERREKNRREVIRRHLAQRSQLRRLKSEVGIGQALVESDGVLRGACQLHACFYGDKARERRPWGQKREIHR